MSDHHTVTMLDGGLHGTPSAEGLTRRRSGPGEGTSGVPTHGTTVLTRHPGPVTEGALEGSDAKSLASFLNPQHGSDELERRFPIYCKQLRWIGVRSSKCEMRTLRLAAGVIGQVLQMWSSYVVNHLSLIHI